MSSSSSGSLSRARTAAQRVLAAISVICLALVALVAMPTAAQAAQNSAIVVGGVVITPADQQATIGDTLTVSGTWDATAADPRAGDEFTIGLPPELGFRESVPFKLTGEDDSGASVTWGNCLTDPTSDTATCVLTSAVTATPEVVKGTWKFEVTAEQVTTADKVEFDLNGTPGRVQLPGGGGIDDGIELPGEVSKSGAMNSNNWSMTWTVELPGANMIGQDTVTLHDKLGAGHQVCTPSGLKVETVRGSTVVDVTHLVSTAPAAGATEFDIVLTAPQGGFDANVTYRVTYQTCTPDGMIDPAGTTYTNSAQVAGWGEAGRGVGEVTNKPWQAGLTKSGSVLGGADRNGKITWTVTIPGSQLVGKTGFTVTETLGAGHQLCTDTISGIKVTEYYGPSNQKQKNITGALRATTTAATTQSFAMRFDIVDPAVSFKDSDYRYVLTYTTCVISDELPAGGTAYLNSVNVDGVVATGEGKVPGRAQGKSGKVNTATVTLDGVAHMPQTTLDWTVTVPGALIENIEDVLTLTDTLSAAHTVCEAGDPTKGMAERLRLKVEARDQISRGGLATVDLLPGTTVSADGQVLTFAIDAIDLPIPTGESTGFSREYEYVLTYTTCTTSGGMDAPGTVYSNTVTGSGITFTTSTTQRNSGSGTGQGVTRGSVAIDKRIADTPGAALIPADATFTVHVKEIDPTGKTQNEYDLQVPLSGAPVSGLNARGTGWTVEITEPTFPKISGVSFGDPVFASGPGVTVSADGKTATAAIAPGTNASVVLTNTALLGSVSLVKVLEGDAAAMVDRAYSVTAKIDTAALGNNVPAQPDRTFSIAVDEPVLLENLPIGATVTFTEVRPVDDDILTWAEPVFSPASVRVEPAHVTTPAAVTLTNRVDRTVGTFSLVKSVTGDQSENPAVPDAVTVTATWNQEGEPGSKTLTVPTDGTAVPFGEDLLIGTKVTLTETPLSDGSSIAWGAPVWAGTGVAVAGSSATVSIVRDAGATVTLENHAATSTAGISILKGIAGEAAGEVDPSTEFPVTATWTDASKKKQSRDLLINAVTPTPLGVQLPAGTVVTITEGTRPGFDTVVWGSITISGTGVQDGGEGSATVRVSAQQSDVTLVTVLNEATWAPGTFSVAKRVEGVLLDDADVPDAVTVVATWTVGDEEKSAEISVPTDGTAVTFPQELPHGTEVTLTETGLQDGPRFTWATPEWSGDAVVDADDGTAVVTIGAADVAEVELVNAAVASLGSLTFTKTLAGDGANASHATAFPVTLTWVDLLGQEQTREIELVAGEPLLVDDLPIGTEVRAEEHAATLADKVRWIGAAWSTADENVTVSTENGSKVAVLTVSGEPGATAAVTLRNQLVLDVLPATGLNGVLAWTLAGAALVAVLAGAILLWVRRRAHA